MNNLLDSSDDEYLMAVANSYATKIDEELNSDLELFRAIDTEALIQQHNLDRLDGTIENAESIPENAEDSEGEIDVDEFIDILNVTDPIIVISDSE